LLDIATIQDGKHDLCIPTTYAELRYSVEHLEALWQVLLGTDHVVTLQFREYWTQLIMQEKRLQHVTPRNPRHRIIMPALLARVIQLDLNHWLYAQMRSATPVHLPSLTDVFADIEREKAWEPTFPDRYLHSLSPAPLYQPLQHPAEISLDGTSTTAASTLTGGTGSGDTSQTPPENPKSLVIRNLNYKEKIFGIFAAKGLLSKKLKESWKARNVYPPKNSKGKGMCVPFHVLGYCNLRCGLAEDHVPHSDVEDQQLCGFCTKEYRIEQ
jgi:hypothetical protein